MDKGTKIWRKPIVWIAAALLLIVLTSGMLVRLPWVQHYLHTKLLTFTEKQLGTRVEIGKIRLAWFLDVVVTDIKIFDHTNDTLLTAPHIRFDIGNIKPRKRSIIIDRVTMNQPDVRLVRFASDSLTNLNMIIKRLSAGESTDQDAYKILVLSVNINDGRFLYRNEHVPPKSGGIDYNHPLIDSIYLHAEMFEQRHDTSAVVINHLAFREQAGFVLDTLHTQFLLSDNLIEGKRLNIRSGNTRLDLDLRLHFDDWADFSSFIDSVQIDARIRPSSINMHDISPFAPVLHPMDNTIFISGTALGTVASFGVKELDIQYGLGTRFLGEVKLSGLPDVYETFVDAEINRFDINTVDLERFFLPGESKHLTLPPLLSRLNGTMVQGSFTGFYNDFTALVQIQSPFGDVFADLVLNDQHKQRSQGYTYNGLVRTPGFNVGALIQNPEVVGNITMDLSLNGAGMDWDHLDADITGRIDSLDLMGERYQGFEINGNLSGKRFLGFLGIDDPNLGMVFNGMIDLSEEVPAFDFLAEIDHASLDKLSRYAIDVPMTGSGSLAMNFKGAQIDRLQGKLNMKDLKFYTSDKYYKCKSVDLTFIPDAFRYKEVSLRSDPADIDITGSFSFQDLYNALSRQIAAMLPSAGIEVSAGPVQSLQVADILLRVNDLNPLLDFILPTLSIAKGTEVRAHIDTEIPVIEWQAESDDIAYAGIKISGLKWNTKLNQEKALANVTTSTLSFSDSLQVMNFFLEGETKQDSIQFALGWQSDASAEFGDGFVSGLIDFPSYSVARLRLRESKIPLDSNIWSFNKQHSMLIDSTGIVFNDVRLQSKDQLMRITGKASRDEANLLDAQFNNFDIDLLNVFLRRYDIDVGGRVDGDISFYALLTRPDIRASLVIRQFQFNGDPLGDASVKSSWDPLSQSLFVDASVSYRGSGDLHIPIELTGFYYPEPEQGRLDLKAKVKDFKLAIVERYLEGVFSNLQGYLTGEVQLNGPLSDLKLSGKAMARRTGFKIDYLNESYSFSHEILISPESFYFNDLILNDARGNSAICSGRVTHKQFKDFRLDFEAKPIDFSSLNTTMAQNELFYGRATLTGNVKINGSFDDLMMNIKGETGRGTSLHIPISYDADVLDNEFITFYQPAGNGQQQETRNLNLSGLRLDFQLTARPDAEVEILLPSRMGNIKGNGQGDLRFLIDTRGEFSIFGDYVIDGGFYLMTLQNLLNRRFDLRKGGRISWSGDPYDANINISAIYRVRASLNELRPVGDSSSIYRQRIPVNCVIRLTDKLINPQISFAIELPDSREEVNRLVFNRIDTTNSAQLSRQIISLLVLNSFISEEVNVNLASGVSASSMELLTRQLSNWLSQISKDFDIGVNYRPGDQITNEELELALSTQLFNDRVLIDGNFGMAGERNAQAASNLVGDVQIEVKLTEDGRFRVKAFNRSNYVNLLDNKAPYTQGVGIFYRKEFDDLRELIQRKKKSEDSKI